MTNYYGIDQHTELRTTPLVGDLLVVTKTQHEAAVQQAEREVQQAFQHGLEVGQRDALASFPDGLHKFRKQVLDEAVQRVEALTYNQSRDMAVIIAAIKGDTNPCSEIPTPKLAYRNGEQA